MRATGVILFALLAASCAAPVRRQVASFLPAPCTPQGAPQYCFNGSPRIADAKPFVFGGRDLSIPTTAEAAAAYKEFDVVWVGNGCSKDANGYAAHGPHVALGGRCLDPPPPGTREYNDIVMGAGVTNWLYPLWRQRHPGK